jgi:DNA-binding response OmpR family regulator
MSANTPQQILIVEEQPVVVELIKLTLRHGRFVTRVADSPTAASAVLAGWRPHLALIDMDLDGPQLLQSIGQVGLQTQERIPAMALTRRGDLKSKLAAFGQGADDFLTIPFAPEELLARVHALLQRTYGEAVPFQPIFRIGELEIDILNRQVRAGTSAVHLTGLEQHLLYLLVANAGRVVTRDEILDALWGVDFQAESNVVDRHIRSLRIKLQNDWRRPRFIATVPGKGYRFVPTFSATGSPPA